MNVLIADRNAGRLLMQVLWPAFLMAIVAEGLFFSLVDPQELTIVGLHLADSREAAYTLGFALFWALFAASNALTFLLSSPSAAADLRVLPGGRARMAMRR